MTEDSASTQSSPRPAGRRRASRAAGPSSGAVASPSPSGGRYAQSTGAPVKVRLSRPAGPPPRRRPHRTLVALVSLITGLVVVAASAGGVTWMALQQRNQDAEAAQDQLYVDTASQFVVN